MTSPIPFSKELEELVLDEYDWMFFFRDIFELSKVVVITGKRGSGKTALGLRLGELAKEYFGRQVWTNLHNTPFRTAIDVKSIPNGSFAVIDEAELSFHARRAMRSQNVTIANIIAISRHKGLSLVFITQAAALMDKLIRSQTDYIFLKEPAALQIETEKGAFAEFIDYALLFFAHLPASERKKYFVTWKDDYYKFLLSKYSKWLQFYPQSYYTWLLRKYATIKCKNKLPSFWSEEISRSFASWGHGSEQYDPFLNKLVKLARKNKGKITSKKIYEIANMSKQAIHYKINKLIEEGRLKRVKRGVYEVVEM